MSGYWKVYSDVAEAQGLFEKFDVVKDDMVRMVSKGYSIKSIVSYYATGATEVAV